MTFYRITNWSEIYENNRTRELKSLTWVPFPNSHDGDGYTALMSEKNAEALLGAFVVIVQVASKCDPRGTLLRAPNLPHTAASIARMTRFSERTIQRCLDLCCSPDIAWISKTTVDTSTNGAEECDFLAANCGDVAGKCLEGKGREGKEGNGNVGSNGGPLPTEDLSHAEWLDSLTKEQAYEGLDVPREFGRMAQWCKTNHKQPTRRRFINWLNRCDRPLKLVSTSIDHSKGF